MLIKLTPEKLHTLKVVIPRKLAEMQKVIDLRGKEIVKEFEKILAGKEEK